MRRINAGFTLVEMMIVIAIFGFVLAGTTQMFVSMLSSQRQQSKLAETNIEGIIGLELLRQDLERAGYGLPWAGLPTYAEPAANPASLVNEVLSAPPRGILSADNGGWNGTDYLAIKAISVATNDACSKWTFLALDGAGTPTTTTWTATGSSANDNLAATDRVIVLSPGSLTSAGARTLVTSADGNFSKQFTNVADFASSSSNPETRLVYGVDSDTDLRRPFNRADYYVSQPTSGMPRRCATGTGILYKAVLNQSDDSLGVGMPLLDCVADLQVIYRTDPGATGAATNWTEDITTLTADQIRAQVKEVRVFILAHEGQRDTSFNYPTTTIHVGDTTPSLGRDFDLSANITSWQNYRWKIYTLVVRPDNLF